MSELLDLGNVHTYHGAFTARELARMREDGDAAKQEEGTAEYAPGNARDCSVAWLTTPWLAERMSEVVAQINAAHFQFELEALKEPMQYARYTEGQHFGWHVDMGGGNERKLSLTVQLSEPDEYEGGELQMQLGCWTGKMERGLGDVIAFPSWLLHRVTPVTKGERRSLVVWAHGPAFR